MFSPRARYSLSRRVFWVTTIAVTFWIEWMFLKGAQGAMTPFGLLLYGLIALPVMLGIAAAVGFLVAGMHAVFCGRTETGAQSRSVQGGVSRIVVSAMVCSCLATSAAIVLPFPFPRLPGELNAGLIWWAVFAVTFLLAQRFTCRGNNRSRNHGVHANNGENETAESGEAGQGRL